MKTIKTMIVDDHQVVREGLRLLLELEPDIEVVAEASSGAQCLEIIDTIQPHVVIMDVGMPGISGIETTRILCQKYPEIKVVVLTVYDDDQYVTEAIQAGAKGYVLKDVKRDELIRIIRHVIEDRAFLDPLIAAKLFNHVKMEGGLSEEKEKPQLTRRELEVLCRLVDGLKDRKISERLFISENTVRSHIKSIYRKLRVSSRSQAVAKAMQERIIHK